MSYHTYVGGEILITPPVPEATVAGSLFAAETVTEAGREVFLLSDPARQATLILPAGPEGRTRDPDEIAGQVNEIIDLVGDGHVFAGELLCEGERHDDIWRVRVVDGLAVEEDAEVVFPADFTLPEGPAVAFNPRAARTWLAEPVESVGGIGFVRGHDFGVAVDGVYDPARGDRPADWLDSLTAAFNRGEAPHVWRLAPGVSVEVVETVDPDGMADGGAVIVVDLPGVRLASRWLEADHLAASTYDGEGRATKVQLDAVIEALTTTAEVVNAEVDRHRLARLASAVAVAAGAGPVRLGYVTYHTPDLPARDAVAGRWTFAVAAGVDFPQAWQAAVAEFRADAQMHAGHKPGSQLELRGPDRARPAHPGPPRPGAAARGGGGVGDRRPRLSPGRLRPAGPPRVGVG